MMRGARIGPECSSHDPRLGMRREAYLGGALSTPPKHREATGGALSKALDFGSTSGKVRLPKTGRRREAYLEIASVVMCSSRPARACKARREERLTGRPTDLKSGCQESGRYGRQDYRPTAQGGRHRLRPITQ